MILPFRGRRGIRISSVRNGNYAKRMRKNRQKLVVIVTVFNGARVLRSSCQIAARSIWHDWRRVCSYRLHTSSPPIEAYSILLQTGQYQRNAWTQYEAYIIWTCVLYTTNLFQDICQVYFYCLLNQNIVYEEDSSYCVALVLMPITKTSNLKKKLQVSIFDGLYNIHQHFQQTRIKSKLSG